MSSLKDALKMGNLNKLVLLAGGDGLSRKVRSVTVMEVPDILQWLNGEEFLITSFYIVKNDEKKQMELVQQLIDKGAACLAVKVGQYADNIKPGAIALANKHSFPILQIPQKMTYIEIIMQVMSYILLENDRKSVMSKFFCDVLFEVYEDQELLTQRGKLLGINMETDCFMSIVLQCSGTNDTLQSIDLDCRHLALHFLKMKGIKNCCVITLDKQKIIYLSAENNQTLSSALNIMEKEINRFLGTNSANPWFGGIGNVGMGANGIRSSYTTALKAISVGRILNSSNNIFKYDELELYCILGDLFNKTQSHISDPLINKIHNKEILKTLIAYYDYSGDIDATAASLFTHRNTVKYRLRRVTELTGLDIKNIDDNFKLHIMVLEYKLKHCQN